MSRILKLTATLLAILVALALVVRRVKGEGHGAHP